MTSPDAAQPQSLTCTGCGWERLLVSGARLCKKCDAPGYGLAASNEAAS